MALRNIELHARNDDEPQPLISILPAVFQPVLGKQLFPYLQYLRFDFLEKVDEFDIS